MSTNVARITRNSLTEVTRHQLDIWARETQLSAEEVLCRLQNGMRDKSREWAGTLIENGAFRRINWDLIRLPIRKLRWNPGQEISRLSFTNGEMRDNPEDFLFSIPFPNLTHLACPGLQLKRIDLYGKSQLKILDVAGNRLDGLPSTPMPDMRELEVSFNEFKSLNLRLYPNLRCLECDVSDLDELDLSPLPRLGTLCCSTNNLIHLDLSASPVLTGLHCSVNHLTEIDLSHSRRLQHLDVTENRIRELSIHRNSSLESLSCGGNPIRHLEIAHLRYLSVATVSDHTDVSCRSDQVLEWWP